MHWRYEVMVREYNSAREFEQDAQRLGFHTIVSEDGVHQPGKWRVKIVSPTPRGTMILTYERGK